MARPAGSYRCARRNEARNRRKEWRKQGLGQRCPVVSYGEVQRLNRMHQAAAK